MVRFRTWSMIYMYMNIYVLYIQFSLEKCFLFWMKKFQFSELKFWVVDKAFIRQCMDSILLNKEFIRFNKEFIRLHKEFIRLHKEFTLLHKVYILMLRALTFHNKEFTLPNMAFKLHNKALIHHLTVTKDKFNIHNIQVNILLNKVRKYNKFSK